MSSEVVGGVFEVLFRFPQMHHCSVDFGMLFRLSRHLKRSKFRSRLLLGSRGQTHGEGKGGSSKNST
jgi:hypothetical protein